MATLIQTVAAWFGVDPKLVIVAAWPIGLALAIATLWRDRRDRSRAGGTLQ